MPLKVGRSSKLTLVIGLLLGAGAVLCLGGCTELFGILGLGPVEEGNQEPSVGLSATVISVESGEKFTITISSLNDDGDVSALNFTWTIINEATGQDLSGALQISDDNKSVSFTAPVVIVDTTLKLTLKVVDADGAEISVTVTITVKAIASGVAFLSLDPELVSVKVDGTATVTATAITEEGTADPLIAVSKAPDTATVEVGTTDQDTKTTPITITGKKKGKADVVVTAVTSGLTKTITVNVFKEGEASLVLEETAVSVLVGETVIVEAIAIDGEGNPEGISSADSREPLIATAEAIGDAITIEGVGQGETEVDVTSDSGETATISVNVNVEGAQESLILSENLLVIPEVGGIEIIEASATKSDGSPDSVTASSNDTSVVTISPIGSGGDTFTFELNGVGTGSTTVTMTSGSGLTDSAQVIVGELPALVLNPTALTVVVEKKGFINVASLDAEGIEEGVTLDKTEVDQSGIATVALSSDSKLITVDGLVSGSAALTVTSDSNLSASVTITVIDSPPGNWDHDPSPPLPGALKWADVNEDDCAETEIEGVKVRNCWG